jgi:hypothetical protein
MWRPAAAVVLAAAAHCSGSTSGPPGDPAAVVIHGGETWYAERTESESRWRGVLRRRAPPSGPGVRTALTFSLQTEAEDLPVYAAGVEAKLAPLAGSCVTVTAKLVDLTSEGHGRELWIGTIMLERGDCAAGASHP